MPNLATWVIGGSTVFIGVVTVVAAGIRHHKLVIDEKLKEIERDLVPRIEFDDFRKETRHHLHTLENKVDNIPERVYKWFKNGGK